MGGGRLGINKKPLDALSITSPFKSEIYSPHPAPPIPRPQPLIPLNNVAERFVGHFVTGTQSDIQQ
jgi:hypothetical protein